MSVTAPRKPFMGTLEATICKTHCAFVEQVAAETGSTVDDVVNMCINGFRNYYDNPDLKMNIWVKYPGGPHRKP